MALHAGETGEESALISEIFTCEGRCAQDVAWKRGHDAGEVIVAVGDDGELNM